MKGDLHAQQTVDCLNAANETCFSNMKIWYDIISNNSLRVLVSQNTNDMLSKEWIKHNSKLTFLQITGKAIQHFPQDVHVALPRLKVLDVSHDMESISCDDNRLGWNQTYANFLTEVLFFHPSLELLISVNDLVQSDIHLKQAMSRYTRAGNNFDLGEAEQQIASGPGLFTPPTKNEIAEFQTNKTLNCEVVKRIFGLNALNCSYDYISYDTQCIACMRMPISPKLQEVYLSYRIPRFTTGTTPLFNVTVS